MIRKALVKDLDKINALGELLQPNFKSIYKLKDEINKDLTILFVNEDKGIVNAYLYAQNLIDHIDLLSIIVHPDWRRKKIGTNLIKYLIDNYCYQDLKPIILEVATDNDSALKLYESFKFKIVNTRKNYYNNKDAFLMKRG